MPCLGTTVPKKLENCSFFINLLHLGTAKPGQNVLVRLWQYRSKFISEELFFLHLRTQWTFLTKVINNMVPALRNFPTSFSLSGPEKILVSYKNMQAPDKF